MCAFDAGEQRKSWRRGYNFPDHHRDEIRTAFADIGMAAFAHVFLWSEPSLAYRLRLERGHSISNCCTPLDEASAALLEPCFARALGVLQDDRRIPRESFNHARPARDWPRMIAI